MNELSAWLAVNTPLESEPHKYIELFADERMRLLGLNTLTKYVERLNLDPREAQILYQHVAPPETWLFRYIAAFDVLREAILKSDHSKMIHVASLGCATGSEPFSIAATALSCGLSKDQFQILALDYSDDHLDITRTGRASALAQRTPIPKWANDFFRPTTQGQLQLDPRGLAMINTVRADLSTWQPQRTYDFVFCRNVAIYLNSPTKKRLGRLLGEMTNPNGLVFLGHADSLSLEDTDLKRSQIEHAFVFFKSKKIPQSSTPVAGERPQPKQSIAVKSSMSVPVARSHTIVLPPPIDLFTQAQIAADSGNLAAAEKALMAYVAIKPTDSQAHVLFGCIKMAQNNVAEAERSFTKVVYLEPLNSLALLSLAAISDLRGDAKSAERFRDRAARTVVEHRLD